MSKHTPAPWKWQNDWTEDRYSSIYDGSMGHLEPGVLRFGMDGEEGIYCQNEADAHLIAAAPEMFEALKLGLKYLKTKRGPEDVGDPDRFLFAQSLSAAIAKAEGDKQ